jgi:hypothetical protein
MFSLNILFCIFKFEFPAACRSEAEIPICRGWSVTEIPTLGAARDEFK